MVTDYVLVMEILMVHFVINVKPTVVDPLVHVNIWIFKFYCVSFNKKFQKFP